MWPLISCQSTRGNNLFIHLSCIGCKQIAEFCVTSPLAFDQPETETYSLKLLAIAKPVNSNYY